jgi:hypothetical protein
VTDHARGPESTAAEPDATEASGGPAAGGEPSGGLESRLRAVERAVTGEETRPADVAAGAAATAERERLAERLDDVEERLSELEAATQAVRGYAGAVRAVNREVERRADLALSRATASERESERGDGQRAERPVDRDEAARPNGAAVPSESALDAALPDSRPDGADGEAPGRPRAEGATGDRSGGEERDDGDGGAWATDALERLRESL